MQGRRLSLVIAVLALLIGIAIGWIAGGSNAPTTETLPACSQESGSNCVLEPPAGVSPPSELDLDVGPAPTEPAPQTASPQLGTVANGYLSTAELSPITGGHPASSYPGTGQLRDDAAAAWNAAAVAIHAKTGIWIDTNGSDSAYRPYSRQVYWRNYWCARGACQNAAVPGTSNHGWGTAADVPTSTSALLERYGAPYGWKRSCSDAPWEPWHWHWCGGWHGRDPGPYGQDVEPPFRALHRGDRGKRVKHLSTQLALLRRPVPKHPHYIDWSRRGIRFDKAIAFGVRKLQRDCHLADDGVYGEHTDACLTKRWNYHKRHHKGRR